MSLNVTRKNGMRYYYIIPNMGIFLPFRQCEIHIFVSVFGDFKLQVLSRRVMTTEPALASIISDITRERRRNLSSEMLIKHNERDKSEAEEIERSLSLQDDTSISLPGRQSGDKVWRIARSEFGSDEHCSLSSSSCPVRKCVDEHVTKIYDAFFPLLHQFVEEGSDSSIATEVLEIIRKILIGLKNSPFKTRRTKIDAVSNSLFSRMLPSLGQLFNALSLKCEPGVEGLSDICIASDPVKTSLALPVVFHALDDLIHNVSACKKLKKESLSWPLLKLNRICSGFVLASGEELPFGIVSSIFNLYFLNRVSIGFYTKKQFLSTLSNSIIIIGNISGYICI